MDNADKSIKIFYYTAWNGYSWQGCGEDVSYDLQLCMDRTGTLPSTTVDQPPYGGALACKISGKTGVAVYRYHIRKKGDAFGRDSLYIALAFIPLDFGTVDFADILSLPQLSKPQQGELAPGEIPANVFNAGRMPPQWAGIVWREKSETKEFSGRAGLAEVSRLFFSEETQLGILKAEFKSASAGIDGVAASVTYNVFPEVRDVSQALDTLEREENAGERHDKNSETYKTAAVALERLRRGRVEKLPEYAGLARYLAEKTKMLSNRDAESNNKKTNDFIFRQQNLNDHAVETGGDECAIHARGVVELPFAATLDQLSKDALKAALDGVEKATEARAGIELVRVRNELDAAKSEVEKLKGELKKNMSTRPVSAGLGYSSLSKRGQIPVKNGDGDSLEKILGWCIIVVTIALVAAIAWFMLGTGLKDKGVKSAGQTTEENQKVEPGTNKQDDFKKTNKFTGANTPPNSNLLHRETTSDTKNKRDIQSIQPAKTNDSPTETNVLPATTNAVNDAGKISNNGMHGAPIDEDDTKNFQSKGPLKEEQHKTESETPQEENVQDVDSPNNEQSAETASNAGKSGEAGGDGESSTAAVQGDAGDDAKSENGPKDKKNEKKRGASGGKRK